MYQQTPAMLTWLRGGPAAGTGWNSQNGVAVGVMVGSGVTVESDAAVASEARLIATAIAHPINTPEIPGCSAIDLGPLLIAKPRSWILDRSLLSVDAGTALGPCQRPWFGGEERRLQFSLNADVDTHYWVVIEVEAPKDRVRAGGDELAALVLQVPERTQLIFENRIVELWRAAR